jgi:fatty-acyl-CoA synthase
VLTWAQLKTAAERLAGRLQALGVAKGDRVLLNLQNTPQLIVAHFAILRADAVVVPVNPMNRADELRHYITDPDARVAITSADLAGELAAASNALPAGQRLAHLIVTQYTDAFDAAEQGDDAPPEAWRDWLLPRRPLPTLEGGQVHAWTDALAQGGPLAATTAGPRDLSVLPYTSGTTGLPKGCMHTHASLMHNAVACTLWGGGTSETVGLVVVPMFHITGMVAVMHAAVYAGATMVLMPRWERELAGRLISRWQVTAWTNIPTMVIDLLASPNFASFDLSSLKSIGGGGAAMPQAVAQRLFDVYGLRYAEGYGLTETAAPSHQNPLEHPKQQCLGIPFMSTDARGRPRHAEGSAAGRAGEIVVCGPQVFSGYWKHPEATAAAFFELEGQRFFRTGDLGRGRGRLLLHHRPPQAHDQRQRLQGLAGRGGGADVQAPRHPGGLRDRHQDAYRGESVKAVVVLRAGHQGSVSEQDIIDWCREHMAAYKIPRVVQFVDALPKSGSGKVMWRLLQEKEAG